MRGGCDSDPLEPTSKFSRTKGFCPRLGTASGRFECTGGVSGQEIEKLKIHIVEQGLLREKIPNDQGANNLILDAKRSDDRWIPQIYGGTPQCSLEIGASRFGSAPNEAFA